MKIKSFFSSIQRRILAITIACVIGMCVLISFVSYYIFRNYIQNTLIHSTESNLKLLTESIDTHINDIYRMVRYCRTDSNIATYIENNPNPGTILSVATHESITEEYNRNDSSKYMPRLAIVTNENFLQVVNSTYSSTSNLAKEIPLLDFYDTLLNAKDYDFSTGFIADPFHRKGRIVLPIIRPITYQYNAVQAGYLFIEISSDLFTDAIKDYDVPDDSMLYFTISEHNYIYKSAELTEIERNYKTLADLTDSSLSPTTTVTKIQTSKGKTQIIVTTPLDMPDCYISQSISYSGPFYQKPFFIGILIATITGIIAIGTVLMLIMNRMITVPVSQLRTKMRKIADGDFSRDFSIEWAHELGDIGRGINDLSENVNQLMDKRVEFEKQKKDLEYKILLNQINPHFIYNTLGSIKWMATAQGANGIAEMTTALSRLLKSISKGTSLIISIREELSLLEDYFTIQKYRYGGTIALNINVSDETLYNYAIIKFTLQPLVENAIFHGIEPKGTNGTITIHIRQENDSICIDVIDDGIGMSKEKANQILIDNSDSNTDFFRELGVSNVHKRIQYQFGNEYGISIESEPGKYTIMSIHLPICNPSYSESAIP